MKEKIHKNLLLSVDYEKERTKSGIYTGKTIFWLIGTLPVLFVLDDGKKEIATLKHRVKIPMGDPQLRNLLGAKAIDPKVAKKYEGEINSLVNRLAAALSEIGERGKFCGKRVKDFALIKC